MRILTSHASFNAHAKPTGGASGTAGPTSRNAAATLRMLLRAAVLCATAFGPAAYRPHAQASPGIVIETIEAEYDAAHGGFQIRAQLSVADDTGLPIEGLDAAAFHVAEDGRPVPAFEIRPSREPISLVLVIDTTGSMAYSGKMDAVEDAVSALLLGLDEEDRLGLVSFDEEPVTRLGISSSPVALMAALRDLVPRPRSSSCLWDAAHHAVELAASTAQGRRAVLVLTDGTDQRIGGGPCSTVTLEDVVDVATSASVRVPVFTVGIGEFVNAQELARVANLTGGRSSLADPLRELTDRFELLALQLGGGYSLLYWTASVGGEHALFVEVDLAPGTVQDMRSYRTPELWLPLDLGGVEHGSQVTSDVEVTVEDEGEGQEAARLEFFLDGALLAEDSEYPFRCLLDTEDLALGLHSLRAVAFDEAGRAIGVAQLEFEYPGAPPTPTIPPPSVQIMLVSPREGETVRETVMVAATVQGEAEGVRVEFTVDGFEIGIDSEPPYEAAWSPAYLESGEHTLRARAYDSLGRLLAEDAVGIVSGAPSTLGYWVGGLALAGAAAAALVLGLRRLLIGRARREPATVRSAGPMFRAVAGLTRSHAEESPLLGVLTVESCGDPALVGTRFEIRDPRTTIGRSREAEISLPIQPVSRSHAWLELRAGIADAALTVDEVGRGGGAVHRGGSALDLWIVDGDPESGSPSTYGTFVDNLRIPASGGVVLRHGSRIRLGRPISEGRVTPVILRFEAPGGAPLDDTGGSETRDVVCPGLAETSAGPVASGGAPSQRAKHGENGGYGTEELDPDDSARAAE